MQSEYVRARMAWDRAVTETSIMLYVGPQRGHHSTVMLCAEFSPVDMAEGKVTMVWLNRRGGDDPEWPFRVARRIEEFWVAIILLRNGFDDGLRD